MVVYPVSEDTVAVIDGQQRLSTLVMLLAALREAATKCRLNSLANGTHNFVERKDENDKLRFVLKTETSYPYLQDHILSKGEPELNAKVGSEERLIKAAFEKLQTLIGEAVNGIAADSTLSAAKKQEATEARLKAIRDKILSLKVIFIEVGTEDDATTIFVTLNSRGKDLEPADLVKAHLMQLLPAKGALDRPLVRWQAIVDKFDSSESKLTMTEFLLTVWQSRYETKMTSAKLTRSVRKTIKKKDSAAFLSFLESDAELYRQISEPTYRKWRKDEVGVRESLQFLRDFQIRQPMPLLLSLIRAFDSKNIRFSQLRRALRAIEDYHFAWNVMASKTSYGGMSAFYSRRAIDLFKATDPTKIAAMIDDVIKELARRRPTSAEFDEAFTSLRFTNDFTSDKRVIFYILRRMYLYENRDTAADFDKMTIEHMLPQSLGSPAVGHIGNLLLVSKSLNAALGNLDFGAKRLALKKAHEWIPADVLKARAWDAATIEKRGARMAELARSKVWA